MSEMVTVKLHVDVFPTASVAWNTLVVVPTGKAALEAKPKVCDVVVPGQLSVPTGAV